MSTLTQEQLDSVAGYPAREAARILGVGKTTVQKYRIIARDNHGRLPRVRSDRAITDRADTGYKFEQGTDGTVDLSTRPSEVPQTTAEVDELLRAKGIDPTAYNVSYGFSEWEQGDGDGGTRTLTSYRVRATPKTKPGEAPKLDPQELIDAIGTFQFTPSEPAKDAPAFVITPSDMQIGKTSYNGGTDETMERVMHSFDKAERRVKGAGFSEIVIAELGDPLENFYNTSSQAQTNDLDLTGQVRVARRLMLEGIKQLAPHAPVVTYATVPSNHGTVRVGFKAPAGDNHNDWGIEISHQLEDAVRMNESYSHVRFVRPARLDESLNHRTISGTNIGMVHGHQARGADKIGEWWKGQTHGRQPVSDSDILIAGHWHSFRVQHSGAAKWVMVSPASDPGSDWFTNVTGEYSETGMMSFITANGGWAELDIL
jgi:hypothetical protein